MLQSLGSQRIRHASVTEQQMHISRPSGPSLPLCQATPHRALSRPPVRYSIFPLITCLTHGSVHVSTLIS